MEGDKKWVEAIAGTEGVYREGLGKSGWKERTVVAPFGLWGAAHVDSGCRSPLDSSSRFHPQLPGGPG